MRKKVDYSTFVKLEYELYVILNKINEGTKNLLLTIKNLIHDSEIETINKLISWTEKINIIFLSHQYFFELAGVQILIAALND